jgi:hypothetical protein
MKVRGIIASNDAHEAQEAQEAGLPPDEDVEGTRRHRGKARRYDMRGCYLGDSTCLNKYIWVGDCHGQLVGLG